MYAIEWSDGRSEECDTYETALDAIVEAYPYAEICHDGDLTEGGDRTLCWADEDAARDDDGQRSVAVIRRA